jgi:hypothetical protein
MSKCKHCDLEAHGRSGMCKQHKSEYNREHYLANKQLYLDKARASDERYKLKVRTFIVDYLQAHPCACGESDPVVLDFDHNDGVEKVSAISDMMRNHVRLEKIQTEIEKCVVRCANCHRRRTAEQFNWWQLAFVYPLASNQLKG